MKRSRPKFWLKVMLALAMIVGVYIAYRSFRGYYYEKQLTNALARLDSEEPGWQWEDRFVKLPKLVKEENAGEEIKAIMRLLALDEYRAMLGSNEWSNDYHKFELSPLTEATQGYLLNHPNALLPKLYREKIAKLISSTPAPEALERANKLGRFPSGVFDHKYRPILAMSLLPDVQSVRNLVRLLSLNVSLELEANRPEQAARDISTMLQTARIFDHDPFFICTLVRSALVQVSAHATHRLLAQSSQTLPATLKKLQDEFLREETLMVSLQEVFRWDRAMHDHDLKLLHTGEYTLAGYLEQVNGMYRAGPAITQWAWLDTLIRRVYPSIVLGLWGEPRHYALERSDQLAFYDKILSWASLPEHQLMDNFKTMKEKSLGVSPFVYKMQNLFGGSSTYEDYKRDSYTGIEKVARATLNHRAHCRSIAAALSAERYRQEKGTWPASWEQLVPQYVPKTLLDPFTGKPLIFKPLPDGMMIYSVGSNGVDDGGKIFPSDKQFYNDIGYRLWNTDQRRVDMSKELKAIEDENK